MRLLTLTWRKGESVFVFFLMRVSYESSVVWKSIFSLKNLANAVTRILHITNCNVERVIIVRRQQRRRLNRTVGGRDNFLETKPTISYLPQSNHVIRILSVTQGETLMFYDVIQNGERLIILFSFPVQIDIPRDVSIIKRNRHNITLHFSLPQLLILTPTHVIYGNKNPVSHYFFLSNTSLVLNLFLIIFPVLPCTVVTFKLSHF